MVYIYHRRALSCLSIKLSHRCLSGALNASVLNACRTAADWFISIDKKTYKKYHSADSIEIKQISQEHVLKSERTDAYAYIRLTEEKQCPFLTEKRLCGVYSKLGPSAMSDTCREYPRSEIKYQNATFKRLSLSCPEVVRQLLFSADAMQLTEEEQYLKKRRRMRR